MIGHTELYPNGGLLVYPLCVGQRRRSGPIKNRVGSHHHIEREREKTYIIHTQTDILKTPVNKHFQP
jgi:hypothetical protein